MSDLHYRLRQFDWLLERAVSVDALMIAGDLLDIRSQVALDVQAVAVRAALRELAGETTVFVASGNHDLDGRDDAGEKVAHWMAQFGAIGVHDDEPHASGRHGRAHGRSEGRGVFDRE